MTTIRCFKKEARFSQENVDRVDSSLRMDFHNNACNEWVGFRLELIGSFVVCIAALLIVMLPADIIKPGTSRENVCLFVCLFVSAFYSSIKDHGSIMYAILTQQLLDVKISSRFRNSHSRIRGQLADTLNA